MSAAAGGDCPEFKVPSSLPELHGLSSEHTRSSTEVAPKDEEPEEEEGEKSKKDEEKEKEEEEGERRRGGRTAGSARTDADRTPAPTPRRRPLLRRTPASAAASPRRTERFRPVAALALRVD